MESLTCCPKIYTYLKQTHIFVKFLVYQVKFGKPLLVVTFFYFLFFNYTSVYFLKDMFTNAFFIIKMKKALKDLATAHFTKFMRRVRNTQILIFFHKICVFALKHISITN